MSLQQMLNTHPLHQQENTSISDGVDSVALLAAVKALVECAQTCTACADACLSEDAVEPLKRCIRTNQDCADMCTTTANTLIRRTAVDPHYTRALLETCRLICALCAQECEKHSHDHCRICAQACRQAERACTELLANLT
ncbi:four-helix bundle copper-binding protein [Arthrobacter sp. TMS1-12-1]